MAQRISGICYIKVDGTQLEVKGGLEAPLVETKREPVNSATGTVGYKETVVTQYVKVSTLFTRDFPIQALRDGTDMTITAEFANGKVYTLSGGFLSNEAGAKGEEGEVELEFSGTRGIWQ
jgi:hypothetical protein